MPTTPATPLSRRLSIGRAMALVGLLGLCFASLREGLTAVEGGAVPVLFLAAAGPAWAVFVVRIVRRGWWVRPRGVAALMFFVTVPSLAMTYLAFVETMLTWPSALLPVLMESVGLAAYLLWPRAGSAGRVGLDSGIVFLPDTPEHPTEPEPRGQPHRRDRPDDP